MKYALMIFVMFLTACGGDGGGDGWDAPAMPATYKVDDKDYSQALLLGDSRCVYNNFISERDCVGYRRLIDVDSLDSSYSKIIIHLGLNDMSSGVNVDVWSAHLAYLIDGIEDKVWCVIPTNKGWYAGSQIVKDYRAKMYATCKNTLEPNIDPNDHDLQHYDDANYMQVKNDIYDAVSLY